MKRSILIILYTILCSVIAFAQTDKTLMSAITPPSPHAQSLLKIGSLPVSNYTGVPDINIPICNVQLKDISLPISISYNASGIKVNEEASRVGLGWILNAGGLVTHTVHGRYNDFCAWSYFNTFPDNNLYDIKGIYNMSNYLIQGCRTNLPFSLPQGMTHETLYKALTSESYINCEGGDLAPDVFHYNFLGYSGKFIFSHSGTIVKEKEDNLKISPITERNSSGFEKLISWIMTAPDGTKYFFTQTEETVFTDRPRDEAYYSAFYLTKIESVNKSVITLSYKKENRYLSSFKNIQSTASDSYITTDYAYFDISYLDKITYPGGYVSFEYKLDRKDYSPEVRLSAIYINDMKGGNVSKWELVQDYFISNVLEIDVPALSQLNSRMSQSIYYNSSWNNSLYTDDWNKKRLKLKGIKHTGNGIASPEAYTFAYNEKTLPTKLSAAQDHWGFYNKAPNKSLIPFFYQNTSQVGSSVKIESCGGTADRNPNPAYTQSFMLEQITYPTGGKINFTFESNKYKTNDFENDTYKRDFMYSAQQITLSANQNQGGNNIPFIIKSLSIPKSGYSLPISSKIILDKSLYIGDPALEISIKRSIDDPNPLWVYRYNSQNLPTPSTVTTNLELNRAWNDITLPAGTYILYVGGSLMKQLKSVDVNTSLFTYPDDFLSANPFSIGGGLRVKEINYLDTEGEKVHTKKYFYSANTTFSDYYTSGRLMAYPRYRQDYNSVGIDGFREEGYSVGYSVVYIEDIDKNGKKIGLQEFNYINKPDKHLYYSWWDDILPYGTGIKAKDENPKGGGAFKYSENGTLLKEVVNAYNNGNYTPKRETKYTYSMLGDGPYTIWGILKAPVGTNARINSSGCYTEGFMQRLVDAYGNDASGYVYSKIPAGYLYPALRPIQVLLSQKEEILYDGTFVNKKVTLYTQESTHFYVTNERVESGGKTVKTVDYVYPFNKQSDPAMKKLTDANRIAEPVEVKESVNTSLNHTSKEYALFDNILQLSVVKVNTGINRVLEPRVTYHKYDSYGNPLHASVDGAGNVVYLWGYQGMYMVAKIMNSTYDEVKTALGVTPESLSTANAPDMTLIDGLRIKLKNSHVFTYTHKPQIGLMTETSPIGITTCYDYDNFGRLKEAYLRDGTSRIVLQAYEYNYANQ